MSLSMAQGSIFNQPLSSIALSNSIVQHKDGGEANIHISIRCSPFTAMTFRSVLNQSVKHLVSPLQLPAGTLQRLQSHPSRDINRALLSAPYCRNNARNLVNYARHNAQCSTLFQGSLTLLSCIPDIYSTSVKRVYCNPGERAS